MSEFPHNSKTIKLAECYRKTSIILCKIAFDFFELIWYNIFSKFRGDSMFKTGDNAVYKIGGVFRIDGIETPSFAQSSGLLYYRLENTFSSKKETVYVPCDSDGALRCVTEEKEFLDCIKCVREKELTTFTARQPALVMDYYKKLLSDNTLMSLLRAYRELLLRQKECEESGKKLRQAEEHYYNVTDRAICEEMTVSFSVSMEQAVQRLRMEFGE